MAKPDPSAHSRHSHGATNQPSQSLSEIKSGYQNLTRELEQALRLQHPGQPATGPTAPATPVASKQPAARPAAAKVTSPQPAQAAPAQSAPATPVAPKAAPVKATQPQAGPQTPQLKQKFREQAAAQPAVIPALPPAPLAPPPVVRPADPELQSSQTPADHEDWGFAPRRTGLTTETKLGMGLVLVLCIVFGAVVYKKVADKQAVAEQMAQTIKPANSGEDEDQPRPGLRPAAQAPPLRPVPQQNEPEQLTFNEEQSEPKTPFSENSLDQSPKYGEPTPVARKSPIQPVSGNEEPTLVKPANQQVPTPLKPEPEPFELAQGPKEESPFSEASTQEPPLAEMRNLDKSPASQPTLAPEPEPEPFQSAEVPNNEPSAFEPATNAVPMPKAEEDPFSAPLQSPEPQPEPLTPPGGEEPSSSPVPTPPGEPDPTLTEEPFAPGGPTPAEEPFSPPPVPGPAPVTLEPEPEPFTTPEPMPGDDPFATAPQPAAEKPTAEKTTTSLEPPTLTPEPEPVTLAPQQEPEPTPFTPAEEPSTSPGPLPTGEPFTTPAKANPATEPVPTLTPPSEQPFTAPEPEPLAAVPQPEPELQPLSPPAREPLAERPEPMPLKLPLQNPAPEPPASDPRFGGFEEVPLETVQNPLPKAPLELAQQSEPAFDPFAAPPGQEPPPVPAEPGSEEPFVPPPVPQPQPAPVEPFPQPEPEPAPLEAFPEPMPRPEPAPLEAFPEPVPQPEPAPLETFPQPQPAPVEPVPQPKPRQQPQPIEPFPQPQPVAPVSVANSGGPAGHEPAEPYYFVQPNESFWGISKKVYGSPLYYNALYAHNQKSIDDPKRLRPNTKLATPVRQLLIERYPGLTREALGASATTTTAAKPTGEAYGFFNAPDGTPAYRIGPDDTLSEIAYKHLGRSSRWVQIYQLNREVLKSPDNLKVGAVIQLPADASRVGVLNQPAANR